MSILNSLLGSIGSAGGNGDSNILYKGILLRPSDFPTLVDVQTGWEWTVGLNVNIISLTSVGITATAELDPTTYSKLLTGDLVRVNNADEAPYNEDAVITKIGSNQITYSLLSSTTSPATGNPILQFPITLTDNDASKTNTGQTFDNGNEIRWVEDLYINVGDESLWEEKKNTIQPKNNEDDVQYQNKNFNTEEKDNYKALNEVNNKWIDIQQPNGFRDLDDTFIDFTTDYFETKITLTAADLHLYTVDINLITFQYTSGSGQTAQQIVTELIKVINVGSEPASALDNGDGTYTINTTAHDVGNDVLNLDSKQTINSYKKQFGITADAEGFIETPSSLTSSGTTAILIVHQDSYAKFINGADITIENVDQPEYNGTFVGTKGTPNQITYPISGSPASPATGAIKVKYVRSTYEFYSDAKKYEYDSPRYISLWFTDSPAVGLYFIYFNNSGTLTRTQRTSTSGSYPFEFSPGAFLSRFCAVSVVYWPDTGGQRLLNDYRFNYGDAKLHEQWLQVNGYPISEGLELQSFTFSGSGSTNAEAQFEILAGDFWFFDVKYFVIDGQPQDISFPARLPIYYLFGTKWIYDEPTAYAFKNVLTGTKRVTYNLIAGGTTGSQVEAGDGRIVPYYIFVSTNTRWPVGVLQGQKEYITMEAARKEVEYDWYYKVLPLINNIGFPYSISVGIDLKIPKLIGILFIKTDDSYTNSRHAKIIKYDSSNNLPYLDLRQVNPPFVTNKRNVTPSLVYMDESGSDSDTEADGTRDAPFLNFDVAIAKAKTFIPTQANQVDIVAKFKVAPTLNFFNLSGASAEWINIYMPGQNLRMSATSTIGSNNKITAESITLAVPTATNIIKKDGAAYSVLNVGKLYSSNANQPLIFFTSTGSLDIYANEILANSDSDFLLDTFTDVTGAKCTINANRTRGRIETNAINMEVTWNSNDHTGGNIDLNANSTLGGTYGDWTGLVNSAGALATIRLNGRKRHSNPQNDIYDPTANILIEELESPHIGLYALAASTAIGGSTEVTVPYDTLLSTETAYQIRNTAVGEITADTNGVYRLLASYGLDTSAVGPSREAYLYVDRGSGYVHEQTHKEGQQTTGSNSIQQVGAVFEVFLRKDDKIKVNAWQNDGALNILGGAGNQDVTYIRITKINNR
jgi:hypothetical protein